MNADRSSPRPRAGLDADPAEGHLPVKPAVLQILVTLLEGPLHGYAILKDVRESSGGAIRLETGPLYRTLARLLDDGLVEEAPEADEPEDGRQRRFYRLTGVGRAVVAAERRRLASLVEATRGLVPDTGSA